MLIKHPSVIVVCLRQPLRDASERRDDPFWEVGSFGCTGCHSKNLMNTKRASELIGQRLAFVQGGPLGFRLICVTGEIEAINYLGDIIEVRWRSEMPLAYARAPVVVDNQGRSDLPLLKKETDLVRRSTPMAKFASAFRTRRVPVAGEIGLAIVKTYATFRRKQENIASTYADAMPWPPPLIEADRLKRYRTLRRRRTSQGKSMRRC